MGSTVSQFAPLQFYRNTTVYLHCDQSRTTPIVTAAGEITMLNYVSCKHLVHHVCKYNCSYLPLPEQTWCWSTQTRGSIVMLSGYKILEEFMILAPPWPCAFTFCLPDTTRHPPSLPLQYLKTGNKILEVVKAWEQGQVRTDFQPFQDEKQDIFLL